MREQDYNVSELCEASDVSRPGYYAWRGRPPGDRELENVEIAETIREIHTHKFKRSYGSPRLAGDLHGGEKSPLNRRIRYRITGSLTASGRPRPGRGAPRTRAGRRAIR